MNKKQYRYILDRSYRRCGTTYVSNRRVSQKGRLCSQENDTNKSQSQDPPANDDKW